MTIKIKSGMKGSNSGRSRTVGTEFLKKISKKLRRDSGKSDIKLELIHD